MTRFEASAEIECLLAARQPHAAVALADRLEREAPQNIAPAARAQIGRAALLTGDHARARRELELYETALGPSPTARLLRGDILFAESRHDEAAAVFTDTAQSHPALTYAWERAWSALLQAQAPVEAQIAFLERWLDAGGDTGRTSLLLAGAYARGDRGAEAADLYLDLEPSGRLGAADYLLADSVIADHRPQAQMAFLQQGVWRRPSAPAIRALYAKVLLRAGEEAAAQAQFEEQVALQGERQLIAETFLTASPFVGGLTDPVLEQAVGVAGLGGAEPERLVQVARALLLPLRRLTMVYRGGERETGALHPYGAASSLHARAGAQTLCAAAAAVLRRALEIDIHQAAAYAVLAEVLRELGDAKGAARARRAGIVESRASPQDWLDLAIDCIAADDEPAALEAVGRAYGVDQGSLEVLPFQDFTPWSAAWAEGAACVAPQQDRQVAWTAVLDEAEVSITERVIDPQLELYRAQDVELRRDRILVNGQGAALGNDYQDVSSFSNPQLAVNDRGVIPQPPLGEPAKLDGQPLFAGHRPVHFNQYFHAVAQNFTRLALLEESGAAAGAPLLVPHDTPAWSRRMLHLIGFPRSRLIEIPEDAVFTLPRSLLLPPCKMHEAASQVPVAALRRRLAKPHARPWRRLFLTRASAAYVNRTLVNESELAAIAAEHGFEALDPGSLDVDEQIALFGETAAICGATGAAFTNMLFMPDGSRALCFSPRETCRNYFPLLACAAGVRFTWCLGHMTPAGLRSRNFPHVPYFVAPETFRRALELSLSGEA